MFGNQNKQSEIGTVISGLSTDECTRTRQEAVAEIEREMNVRFKCFDKWIADGRLAEVDAKDRAERMISAWHYLNDTKAARKMDATAEANK
jgi:hypothetical protein